MLGPMFIIELTREGKVGSSLDIPKGVKEQRESELSELFWLCQVRVKHFHSKSI